jgi:hypothetical protein
VTVEHGPNPGLRGALLGPFLNLHASGGDCGITHVLDHIGPAQRERGRTLGTYPVDDDYVPVMAGDVAPAPDPRTATHDSPEGKP